MNHTNHDQLFTDQLERRLIQEEIGRQLAFAPVFDVKRLIAKLVAPFVRNHADRTVEEPRTAH